MNNTIDFYSKFKEEDLFLKKIFGDNDDKYLNIFFLINRIINNLKEDTIIVTPNKKELAYISSIYSSLSFFYENYQIQHKNFEQWLKPGQNVSLVSSGIHTGTVFKYLGREGDKIIIETIPKKITKDAPTKITTRFETILQFAPTSATRNMGNRKDIGIIPKPEIPIIDKLLNIKSFKNPILYENKILLLCDSVERCESFFNNETLNINNKEYKVNELITFGKIDPDGNVKGSQDIYLKKKIESNIIAVPRTDNLYNYLHNNPDKKIIICSNIRKISLAGNFIQYKQIKNENSKNKFLIFADENEFEDIEYLKKNNSYINVFKLFTNDIEKFYDSSKKTKLPHSTIEIKEDIQALWEKKNIPLIVKNNIFNEIDQIFLNIRNNLFYESENSKEIIKDLIMPLNNLRFYLQDHIFGFSDEIFERFSQIIALYESKFKSKKSFLSEKIVDNLSNLLKAFNLISKEDFNLFANRLNQFKLILEENQKIDTVVYAHDIERKNYLEKNINDKFNLNHNAIASKNSIQRYKNLIVPSEIITKYMKQLINNNNYTNLFFIGGNNLSEKINDIKKQGLNQWKNIAATAIKKCEILNLEKIFEKDLLNPIFLPVQKINKTEVKIEDFLYDDYSNINLKDEDDEENTTPAVPVSFKGDVTGYLTENFITDLLNPILDSTAYDSKNILKKTKELEPGDIIMLRDSTDKDILDKESEYIYNGKLTYSELVINAKSLKRIIIKSFGENINLVKFKENLLEFNYSRDKQTIKNIATGDTVCPIKNDLIKILKTCSANSSNYLFESSHADSIYKYASEYKSLRGKAGKSIKPKIFNALRKMNIDFDGNPLRVDYISNGSISLGSDTSDKPEAWIVEVSKNYKELKNKKNSELNKVIF